MTLLRCRLSVELSELVLVIAQTDTRLSMVWAGSSALTKYSVPPAAYSATRFSRTSAVRAERRQVTPKLNVEARVWSKAKQLRLELAPAGFPG